MKRRKAVIVGLCVLAMLPAILIFLLLLPRRAPAKVVVLPLTDMLRLSRAPG